MICRQRHLYWSDCMARAILLWICFIRLIEAYLGAIPSSRPCPSYPPPYLRKRIRRHSGKSPPHASAHVSKKHKINFVWFLTWTLKEENKKIAQEKKLSTRKSNNLTLSPLKICSKRNLKIPPVNTNLTPHYDFSFFAQHRFTTSLLKTFKDVQKGVAVVAKNGHASCFI